MGAKKSFATVRPAARIFVAAQSFDVFLQFGNRLKAAADATQQAPVEFARGGCETVVHPKPILPRLHQPRPAQVCQMPGHLRLWNIQNIHQIANAGFPGAKQVEQTQPRTIRECPKHHINPVVDDHCIHIRVSKYMFRSPLGQGMARRLSLQPLLPVASEEFLQQN